jgi:hypothetical protein
VVKSGANGKTPTFRLQESGAFEATFDGGKTWQLVGDVRKLFTEAVAEVLKGQTDGR